MRRVAGWLRRVVRTRPRGQVWDLIWSGGMAVTMWLFIVADCLAGVAAIAGIAMFSEAVKVIRRRRRGRLDKHVERSVSAELTDESLQSVLTCWSKRYRR